MRGPFGFNFPHFLICVVKSINFPLIVALATPHGVLIFNALLLVSKQ